MKTKLENGQKLPPQFRTVSLRTTEEGEGQRITVDAESRTVFGVSVSSHEPYERYYGTEILLHTPEAVNMTRFKKKAAPLLLNHDRAQLLGKPLNPRLEEGRLVVDLKFAKNALAQECLTDLQDGILTECSIGYTVDKFEVDEKEEVYTALKWEVFECSMVTIPADFTVGVGRDSGIPENRIEIEQKKSLDETRTNENKHSQERDNSQKREKPMDPLTPEQIEAKAAEAKAAGQREERERGVKIQELSEHFATKGLGGRKIDTSLLAAQFIKDGKTVDEFRNAVMEGMFKDVQPIQTPDNDGKIEVVGDRAVKGRSIGAEFVSSKEYKAASEKRAQGERVVSREFDVSMLGIRGKVAMAQRAGFTSSDLASVNVQIQTGVVGLGVQRLTVMDLIAPGQTGAAAIIYPRENTFGTVDGVAIAAGAMPRAKSVGERGLKPNWDPDLTTETAPVKKIAITTKVPDEFMSDFPASQSYIDERLPFMVDTETEYQILYGDGLGNNLKGITSIAGLQHRAITTTDDSTKAASLLQGLTDIRVNSFFEPDGYAFHPYDWETAKLLKDADKQFYAGGPFYIPYTNGVFVELNTFWGKPVVVSTAVTYGKPLAGAWKLGAQYFMREGMRLEMTNANEDDFKRNLIAIRAEHRLALAVYRPLAFLEFTAFPARA